ncbi:uncharacterized protein CIMG_11069 [Coccidioides immitis RS]|uniref:Uncharacterized protein n=4 Tax=Coccidioides immitis TaxID=5501 RepID=A0A0D8JWZ5_COCIM|nr:uncharacterized protein CIMG_11069 [Coccidioides immitis RS]KJF61461.1 hypothetical protein CIMG_11069 [Coccidioides immitis RS]KMP07356.1 hypothetical protein CIRG_07037 [Coccidioides immitis RMSCC 2394]KMU72191.1 hypothetical protein CISG_00500 [Coccidioides immitis RMSCC 3703]KMU82436.1 hypothetical protein CIHG_00218 [Coccidioides immitis H538.4]
MPTGLRTQLRAPYGVHPLNSIERRATETKVITEKRRLLQAALHQIPSASRLSTRKTHIFLVIWIYAVHNNGSSG